MTTNPSLCMCHCCPTARQLAADGGKQRLELRSSVGASAQKISNLAAAGARRIEDPRPSQDIRPKAKRAWLTLPVKRSPRGTAPLTLRETRKSHSGPKRDKEISLRTWRGVWDRTLALLILLVSQVIQQAFVLCSPEI